LVIVHIGFFHRFAYRTDYNPELGSNPVLGTKQPALFGIIEIITVKLLFLLSRIREKVENRGTLREVKHEGNDDHEKKKDEEPLPLLANEVLQGCNHEFAK
jgi:hypothetical protein